MTTSHQTTITCNWLPNMKSPNSTLARPSVFSATLVDLVISTDSPSTMPCTANRLPSVTISDGTAVRIDHDAVDQARRSARKPCAAAMPSQIGIAEMARDDRHGHGTAGTIAPTEMSSSPAIISRPTGMAMTPRLAATFSQLDMPASLQKGDAAEDREKDQHGQKPKQGARFGTAQKPARRDIGCS